MEDKNPLDPQKDAHNIDDLEQNMYSREFKTEVSPRSSLSPEKVEVETEWKHESPVVPVTVLEDQPVAGSLVKKIFIISAIFFALSASIAAFIFYGGLNIISPNKVDISFVGPVSIAAGDELGFDIIIHNQNRTPLLNAQLYIDYPDGTKEAANLSQDLLHSKDVIGDVAANTDTKRSIRAVLFGRERSDKEIKVTLEYGVKNSNGYLKKKKLQSKY